MSQASAPASAPAAPSPRAARPWAALVVLCASQLMVILDGSIVAVALPAIGAEWDVAGPALAWVVNAYLIPFGGLLLLAGRVGDLWGARRVLAAGLVVFTVASALCGLAPTLEVLIVARFVQGVGGALASAVVLGMIVTLFAEPVKRGRALGVYAFVGAAGSAVGLVAGGLLTEELSWPWIFWINVPLGLGVVLGVRRLVPARAGTGGRADVLGAVLVTAGVMLAVYTLLSTGSTAGQGGNGLLALLLSIAAAGLLGAFLIRQRRTPVPLLPLRLLADRATVLGNLLQALMVGGCSVTSTSVWSTCSSYSGTPRCKPGWPTCPCPSSSPRFRSVSAPG